jgi:hypothetical protein
MSSDVYKTFSNLVNNEMDEIIYIVSKNNKDTFTKELFKFNDNDALDNYNIIINKKEKDKEATNENYKNTIKLFVDLGEKKSLEYLKKYKFVEGLEYKDLIKEIENKIKEKINEEHKNQIMLIRYKIFELFTNNSFGENNILDREKEYKKIFNENKKLIYEKKEILNLLFKNNYNDIENFKEEINNLNIDENNIELHIIVSPV